MPTEMENIEIRKIKEIKNQTLQFEIAFHTKEFNTIVVKGFRVGPSPKFGGIWVQAPAFNRFGKFVPLFFLENTQKWKEIEILAENLYEEHYKEKDILDLDEIVKQLGQTAIVSSTL